MVMMSSEAESTGKCAVTGLDYFGARYFSGAQGRFTTPDKPFADQQPEDPQSWNLYAYVRNNPLRRIDVNGGYSIDVHRDLTQVLALAAGYSNSAAAAVARADQGVDDSKVTGPFVSVNARYNWHFPDEQRLDSLAQYTVGNLNSESLGQLCSAKYSVTR